MSGTQVTIAAGSVAVALGIFAWLMFDQRRTLPRRRRDWVTAHSALPDDLFAAKLGLAGDAAAVAVAVRTTLADCCGIPASYVSAEDSLQELHCLTFEGFGALAILTDLEDRLGATISDELAAELPDPDPLPEAVAGEWIRQMTRMLMEADILSPANSRKPQ